MNNWIDVNENPPPIYENVLLVIKAEKDRHIESNILVGYRKPTKYGCVWGEDCLPDYVKVTHWMPLPESP